MTMSNTLVRKGLELLGYEKNSKQGRFLPPPSGHQQRRGPAGWWGAHPSSIGARPVLPVPLRPATAAGMEKRKRKHTNYKGALDLIPAKHRILSKNDKTDLGTVLGRSSKVTVYETKKRLALKNDCVDENVQRLLMFSNNRVDPNVANKLLARAVNKKYIPKTEKPKEPEKTAFTEEDFKKFEQEYVDQ